MLYLNGSIDERYKMKKALLLAGVACLMSANVEAGMLSPYVGADYVHVNTNYKKQNKAKEGSYADKFNSYALSAGIRLTNYFAVEGFYQQSENKDKNTTGGYDGASFKNSLELKSYGIDIVKDVINLGMLEVLTSVGYVHYEAETKSRLTLNGSTAYAHDTEEGDGLRFGVGGQVNLNDNVAVRGMFRYAITDLDTVRNYKEFSIGLRYYFW